MSLDFNAWYVMSIGGETVTSPQGVSIINPATGEVIATAPKASSDQLNQAVDRARAAFGSWSVTALAATGRAPRNAPAGRQC